MKVGDNAYEKAVAAWRSANGQQTPAVESALADAVREAVRANKSADVAAYMAHCGPTHLTWFGQKAIDAAASPATQLTAAKFADALRAELDSLAETASVKSYPNRMRWIAEHLRDVAPDVPFGKRIFAAVDLGGEAVAAFVNPGVFPNGQPLASFEKDLPIAPDRTITPDERALLLARHRDVNNLVWTETCFALAERTAGIDIETAARYGGRTSVAPRLRLMASPGDFELASMLKTPAFTRVNRCVHTADYDNGELIDAFGFVVPIGELGEPLAQALSEAARIMVAASQGMGELPLDTHVQHWLSFQPSSQVVLNEGIVSIAQALGLLLVKAPPPPFNTPREALKEVVRSRLATQLAAMAPFGVIGPLALCATVPTEPCSIVPSPPTAESARLRLPKAWGELCDALKTDTIRNELNDPMLRTQTMRGCPIAGRGPIVGDDGKVRMSDNAALTALVNAFAELALKLLDKHEAAAKAGT